MQTRTIKRPLKQNLKKQQKLMKYYQMSKKGKHMTNLDIMVHKVDLVVAKEVIIILALDLMDSMDLEISILI